jgi:hypothetical protein
VLLNEELLRQRYEVLALLTCLRGDGNLTVATLEWAHGYLTVDFRHDSRVRWVTSLEELGNTRQTTSDITCTTYGTWNLDEGGTCRYLSSVFYHYVTVNREVVGSYNVALSVEDVTRRYHRTVLRLDDDMLGHACRIIGLSLIGRALDEVVKANLTSELRNDDSIEWVPLSYHIATLNGLTILEEER